MDTHFNPVYGPFNPPSRAAPDSSLYTVMYINHYHVKAREDFMRRLKRGSVSGGPAKSESYFEEYNARLTESCEALTMQQYKRDGG